MRYQHQFFRCLQVADYRQRSSLYRIAHRLAQQGADILITCDTDHGQNTCSLWVNLRPRHQVLSNPEADTVLRAGHPAKDSLAS